MCVAFFCSSSALHFFVSAANLFPTPFIFFFAPSQPDIPLQPWVSAIKGKEGLSDACESASSLGFALLLFVCLLRMLLLCVARYMSGNSPLSRLRHFLPGRHELRVLMNGLDSAGKTTILYRLKLGEVVVAMPTMGFNVESLALGSVSFTVWDIGGRSKTRSLWRHYMANADALIWVVDSTDRQRLDNAADPEESFGCSRQELHKALAEDELRDVVLLVFANKQDLPTAMSSQEISQRLGLPMLTNKQWLIQGCSAATGEGLNEGLQWLSEAVKRQKKTSPPIAPASSPSDLSAPSSSPSPSLAAVVAGPAAALASGAGAGAGGGPVPGARAAFAVAGPVVVRPMEAMSSSNPGALIVRPAVPHSERRALAAVPTPPPSGSSSWALGSLMPWSSSSPSSSASPPPPPPVVTKLVPPPLSSRRKLDAISCEHPDVLAVVGEQHGWARPPSPSPAAAAAVPPASEPAPASPSPSPAAAAAPPMSSSVSVAASKPAWTPPPHPVIADTPMRMHGDSGVPVAPPLS